MNYIIQKDPSIRIDLMVEKRFLPTMVSYCQRMGCKYEKETECKPIGDRNYVVLKDISGKNGATVGELIGLFYSLEWGTLMEGENQKKFYILINRRKKAKKHAGKDRKETGEGRDSGDSGESAGNPGSGTVDQPAGDGDDSGDFGVDDLWELPRVE